MLTYEFINLTKNTAELVLSWEEKTIPVVIEFAVERHPDANATAELKGSTGSRRRDSTVQRNYALANKTNLKTALTWV